MPQRAYRRVSPGAAHLPSRWQEVAWQCPSLGPVEEEQVEMGSREVVLEEKPFDQCRSLRQTHLPAPDDPERLGSELPAQVPLLVLPHCRLVEERARIH